MIAGGGQALIRRAFLPVFLLLPAGAFGAGGDFNPFARAMQCLALATDEEQTRCAEKLREEMRADRNRADPQAVAVTYSVPSGSMAPTILAGDFIVAGRQYYRTHEPRRGEIAVIKWLNGGDPTEYVKRIVGLPGDHIQLRHGELYLNDQPVARRQIEDYSYRDETGVTRLKQYVETLPLEGDATVEYRIVKIGDTGPLDNTPLYEVPADHYFVLGDNRDNSNDSRVLSAFGYIPRQSLIARADSVYWPLDRMGIELH